MTTAIVVACLVALAAACARFAARSARERRVRRSLWGDGSDGVLVVRGHVYLDRDRQFERVVLEPGAVLHTRGHHVRVRSGTDGLWPGEDRVLIEEMRARWAEHDPDAATRQHRAVPLTAKEAERLSRDASHPGNLCRECGHMHDFHNTGTRDDGSGWASCWLCHCNVDRPRRSEELVREYRYPWEPTRAGLEARLDYWRWTAAGLLAALIIVAVLWVVL